MRNFDHTYRKPPVAILTVDPVANGGGVRSSLRAACRFLSKHFEPTIMYASFQPHIAQSLRRFNFTPSVEQAVFENIPVVEVGTKFSRWEPGHYWFVRDAWAKLLEPYRYVFVTSGTPLAAHPALFTNKKYILWTATTSHDDRKDRLEKMSFFESVMHRASFSRLQEIEHDIVKMSQVLLPMSAYAQSLFDNLLYQRHPKSSICGYPIEALYDNEFGARDKSALTMISVGRFSDARKNLNMIMRVAALLRQKGVEYCWHLVGSFDHDDQVFSQFLAEYQSSIVTHTNLSQERLAGLYAGSDLSVMTSYQEGLGIVGLEAMSHGLSVISTRSGGVEDFVKDGVTGYLVDHDDDQAMVEKIIKFHHHRNLCRELGQAARGLISKNFSVNAIEKIMTWAFCKAYPELEAHFVTSNQEYARESTGRGTYLLGTNKSSEMEDLCTVVQAK